MGNLISVGTGTAGKASWFSLSASACTRVCLPLSCGKTSAFGVLKLNALVKSPHTARRYGLIFGSFTPKRFSKT